ncbi:hypothetical protein [Undibacterium terreum]|uniref:Uncharacterized protein n=1 Tax=Undibacterium terreum TaxID=1224302 RepID=A0A916UCK1_9BURK|nr:hypothetical protein [Undibacterium terreum]GGC66057.1 hypothetical protein GCM10011396_11310 [Undibacterium terreum]
MSKTSTFLAGCTTTLAALTAVFVLSGAKISPKNAQFDEITVGRINVVEPDGSKRLIISNRAQFPGDFEQGKENPRPDRRSFAGMIFLDEEGNENGGFIQNGSQTPDGKIRAGLSLTFDRYRQDQALQLVHNSDENRAFSSIQINDVPSYKVTSMEDVNRFKQEAEKLSRDEQNAYWARRSEEGRLPENRINLGTTADKGSALSLKDEKGRTRMLLLVTAAGKAEIRMMDEKGQVIKTVSAEN